MTGKDFLQLMCTFPIDFDITAEVELSVCCCLQHGRHGILSTMARARGQRIEHTRGENGAKGKSLIAGGKVRKDAVVELITDTCHTDALTSVAECLRTADEQDVVVRVVGHRRLVGRMVRTDVTTEVHGEIGQILHNDAIVSCSQFADSTQFLVRQANPRRIVGIGINNGADVAIAEVALQFRAKFLATEIVDIKRFIFRTLHLQLHFLYGKSWVNKENGVLFLVCLRTSEERGISALHRSADRHAPFRGNVHIDEGLDKFRSGLFQGGKALDVGITVGDSVLQRLDLCLDADVCGRESGDAHLHLYELNTTFLLSLGSHTLHLADGRFGEILDTMLTDCVVYQLLVDGGRLHLCASFPSSSALKLSSTTRSPFLPKMTRMASFSLSNSMPSAF